MVRSKSANVFWLFYKSVTDLAYYDRFAKDKTIKAVMYLLTISTLFFLIGMIPGIMTYRQTLMDMRENIEAMPDFSIRDGRLHMAASTPQVVLADSQSSVLIVFDPSESFRRSDLDYYDLGLLLTNTQFIQKTGNRVNTINLEDFRGLHITKDSLLSNFGILFISLIPVLVLYLLFFGVGAKLLASYILSLFGSVYAALRRIRTDRSAIFRMSCHAISLPVLIGGLTSLFGFHIALWDWIFLLIGFLYLFNAIKTYADQNNLYDENE